MTDAQGVPLSATVTAANVPEVAQVFQALTGMPPVGGKPGRKRQRPERLQGDRGYDSELVPQRLRRLGITPMLAARRTEHGSGLGVFRGYSAGSSRGTSPGCIPSAGCAAAWTGSRGFKRRSSN